METIWQELTGGFTDRTDFGRVIIRLTAALILGAIVGYQRERAGKPAGLRTHILVAMGTTLFVVSCVASDMREDAISRVIQGITTGIGFIGTGAIMKQSDRLEIHGLTTAAGIWMTAALGVAIGLGRIGIAIFSAILGVIVLSLLGYFERFMEIAPQAGPGNGDDPTGNGS